MFYVEMRCRKCRPTIKRILDSRVMMKKQIQNFETEILPYFFNTSGKLCSKRLSSMMVIIVAWLGSLYYVLGNDPWPGTPGIIVPFIVIAFGAEVNFVIEQAGSRPKWGGLDPLGWFTDYNGHPSTHRIKHIVSSCLGIVLILAQASGTGFSSGGTIVAMSLYVLPSIFWFPFELIERQGHVKAPPQ